MKLYIILIFVSLAKPVMGAEKTKKSKELRKPLSSAQNRQNKVLSFTSGVELGASPVLAVGVNVGAGLYLSPNNLLDLRFVQSASFDWYFDEEMITHTKQVALLFRHFVSNSFNIAGGGFYRMQEYHHKAAFGFGETSFYHDIYSYGPKISIGNQWQWSRFTIGGDWLILTSTSGTKDKRGSSEHLGSEDIDRLERRSNERAEKIVASVRVRIGASF